MQREDMSNGEQKLFKTITQQGSQSIKPQTDCTVQVHYTGTLAKNGAQFDSSRTRGKPFEFVLGQGAVIHGWDVGVATMELGERAIFDIHPDWGYGEEGAGEAIPKNAHLCFDVELLGWTYPDMSKKQDGSLIHKLNSEGTGEATQGASSTITCNYKLFISESDISPVINIATINQNQPSKTLVESVEGFKFVFGDEQVHPLFERLVGSMTLHENKSFFIRHGCSELSVSNPDLYQYMKHSKELISTFQSLQNDESVQYVQLDLEVTGVERVDENSIKPDEKLAYCEEKKTEGNDFFRSNRLVLALRRYNRIVNVIDASDNSSLSDTDKKALNDLKATAYTNMAMVYFKQQNLLQTESSCTSALELDPNNVKALFKRSQVYSSRQDWVNAYADLKKATAVDPENKPVQQEYRKVSQKLQQEKTAEKQLYQKMFGA